MDVQKEGEKEKERALEKIDGEDAKLTRRWREKRKRGEKTGEDDRERKREGGGASSISPTW